MPQLAGPRAAGIGEAGRYRTVWIQAGFDPTKDLSLIQAPTSAQARWTRRLHIRFVQYKIVKYWLVCIG